MAASSEQQSAATIVRTPAIAQAASSQPPEPSTRALFAETMKMPDPIIEPTTSVVASSNPMPRTSWGFKKGAKRGGAAASSRRSGRREPSRRRPGRGRARWGSWIRNRKSGESGIGNRKPLSITDSRRLRGRLLEILRRRGKGREPVHDLRNQLSRHPRLARRDRHEGLREK